MSNLLNYQHFYLYIRFSDLVDRDTATADLVIVLGTSLLVAPICMIPGERKLVWLCRNFVFPIGVPSADWVGNECHRLLINRYVTYVFWTMPC